MDRTRRIGKKVDGTKMSEGRSTINEIRHEIIEKKIGWKTKKSKPLKNRMKSKKKKIKKIKKM